MQEQQRQLYDPKKVSAILIAGYRIEVVVGTYEEEQFGAFEMFRALDLTTGQAIVGNTAQIQAMWQKHPAAP